MAGERSNNSDLREYFGQVRGIDADKRTVTGYASTGEIDRYGEVVDPAAFKDLDRFLKERHLFAAGHRYVADDGSPTIIGKVLDARIDGKGLQATFQFDTDELSQKWWDKYQSGTLNAFSIGFIPRAHEMRFMKVGDQERQVRTYTDVELLEISAVPIPANRESIVTNAHDTDDLATLIKRVDEVRDYVRDFAEQVLTQLGVLVEVAASADDDEPPVDTPTQGKGTGLVDAARAALGL